MTTRRWTSLLALVAAIAISLAALRSAWVPVALARGQFQPTFYELFDGQSGVAFGEQQSGYLAPDVDLDSEGRLSVPPGRTVALPLDDGIEYGVTNSGRLLAPYVAVGVPVQLGDAVGSEPGARRLQDAQIIDLDGAALRLVDWDASRAWPRDRAWLESLTTACRDGSSLRLSLQRSGDLVTVRLGRCSLRTSLPVDGRPRVMVVVAGLNWAVVERGGGWRVTREVSWWFVAAILLQVALAALAIAPFAALGLSLWIGGLSLFGTVAALIGFAVVVVITCAAAMIAGVRRVLTQPRMAWIVGSAAVALVLLVVVWSLRRGDMSQDWDEVRFERGDNACGIIGYSTVRGDTLRRGSPSAWEYLDQQCSPCRGTTARYAKEAQKLDWVRDTACAATFTLSQRGTLVFFGGGNDDFFWAKSAFNQIFRFVGLLTYAYQRPDEKTWQQFVKANATGSLLTIETQIAAIKELALCLRARQQRLLFVHDFLIWDLDEGRPAERRQMFERRRAAVAEAGAQFVDVLMQLGPEVGVSWFNDFIHPSAIGHQRIAELICRGMSMASE